MKKLPVSSRHSFLRNFGLVVPKSNNICHSVFSQKRKREKKQALVTDTKLFDDVLMFCKYHCVCLFYIKCFQIACPTTNLYVIVAKFLNFLDFLPTVCLSFLNQEVRGLMTF